MQNKMDLVRKVLLFVGVIFIAITVSFYIILEFNIEKNIKENQSTINFITNRLLENTIGFKDDYDSKNMPIMTYSREDFVGILEIPRFKVKLPINDVWDKNRVKKYPCRYKGSSYEGNMIIGGTDFRGQFDFVSKIDIADEVSVIDVKGTKFKYKVSEVRHTKNITPEKLQKEGYDLILFSKCKKTRDYIIILCSEY